MNVRIKENSRIAKLAAIKLKAEQVAIVFGTTIHLYGVRKANFLADKSWVCHELKHVLQYQQYGFINFLCRYIWEWIKKGYFMNKFEIEAREQESNNSLFAGAEFI